MADVTAIRPAPLLFFSSGYFVDASVMCLIIAGREDLTVCKSRSKIPAQPVLDPPYSSACNLPSDSPCLKDTEDGVKEVSRV